MIRKKIKSAIPCLCWLVCIMSGLCVFLLVISASVIVLNRNHWEVRTEEQLFTESAKKLDNPNRGFYNIYGFVISDEKPNYKKEVSEKLYNDEYTLSMVQINLRNYMEGPISEAGLSHIDKLFSALQEEDRQYIVRFLYDWGGLDEKKEPDDIRIVLNHMKQLKDILQNYSSMVFTYQGVFIGSCGEMHSSAYVDEESLQKLIKQFLECTPQENYLSVRTPQQWRMLTGYTGNGVQNIELASRLGLFNDGIMGTSLDTGTYGDKPRNEAKPTEKWARKDELDFQENLCNFVPNGGEVIIENPINDFENAVEALTSMRVTYLNRAYDREVLEKWANSTVTKQGCFFGMDGLSFVEHHLGYRLLIETSCLDYKFWSDKLQVTVNLKNVGFAPMYKEPEGYLLVRREKSGEYITYPVDTKVRSLVGGNDTELLLPVVKEFSISGYEEGIYELYFCLKDTDSGKTIGFANDQDLTEYGYYIGNFEVYAVRNPITGNKIDLKKNLENFLESMEELQEGE